MNTKRRITGERDTCDPDYGMWPYVLGTAEMTYAFELWKQRKAELEASASRH